MAATNWTKSTTTATAFSSSFYISILGVIMNDTVYTMNSSIILMNDQTNNPAHGIPKAYTKTTVNATAWTKI